MSPVFGHGRLRLYLLKLLDETPRHGYEIIRLLQDRFLGVYAPSPGTVYPRLSRLEEEGLVTHDEDGGRKVYRLTDDGREELHQRLDELEELEREISDSVRDIAREVREDVRDTVRSLREELKHAAQDVRRQGRDDSRDARHEDRQAHKERTRDQRQRMRDQQERLRDQRQAWKQEHKDAWRQAFRGAPWDWDAWSEWAQRWSEPWTDATAEPPSGGRAEFGRMLSDFGSKMRDEAHQAARHLDDDAVLACREVLDEAARRLRAIMRDEPDNDTDRA